MDPGYWLLGSFSSRGLLPTIGAFKVVRCSLHSASPLFSLCDTPYLDRSLLSWSSLGSSGVVSFSRSSSCILTYRITSRLNLSLFPVTTHFPSVSCHRKAGLHFRSPRFTPGSFSLVSLSSSSFNPSPLSDSILKS